MHPALPAELWWRVAVFADEVGAVRGLERAVRDLRPERSLLFRTWSWLDEVDIEQYNTQPDPGYILADISEDLDSKIWPSRSVFLDDYPSVHSVCRYHSSSLSVFFSLLRLSRADIIARNGLASPDGLPVSRRVRSVHQSYRLPRSLVRRLRSRGSYQVLALAY